MESPMTETTVRYDLPRHTWRALHSAFVDYAVNAPVNVQAALLGRIGGDIAFERFMLAVHHAHVLNVSTTLTDNVVLIGVSIPVSDGPDWVLFVLEQRDHGVDPEWLIAAGLYRVDEQLDVMLGGGA
jgi:hypothetical protein